MVHNATQRSSKDAQAGIKGLGVSEPESSVERRDLLQVSRFEVEIGTVQILSHPLGLDALGNDDESSLSSPSEQDLPWSTADFVGDFGDDRVGEKRINLLNSRYVEFDPAEIAKVAIESAANRSASLMSDTYLAGPKEQNAIILISNALQSCS